MKNFFVSINLFIQLDSFSHTLSARCLSFFLSVSHSLLAASLSFSLSHTLCSLPLFLSLSLTLSARCLSFFLSLSPPFSLYLFPALLQSFDIFLSLFVFISHSLFLPLPICLFSLPPLSLSLSSSLPVF